MDFKITGSTGFYYRQADAGRDMAGAKTGQAETSERQTAAREKNVRAVSSETPAKAAGTKKIVLTEYADILTAINEGTLTVDGATLELSKDARNAIKEAHESAQQDQAGVNAYNMAVHNMHQAEQQADAVGSALQEQAEAIKIAQRISKGGQVPPQDEKALMDYSPEMYQMAKQAALMAEERKKYDSIHREHEPAEVDFDEGRDDTLYRVQVEISGGDEPQVEAVNEVSFGGGQYGNE